MFIRTKSDKAELTVQTNATDESVVLLTVGHGPVEVDDAVGRSLLAAHDAFEQVEVAPVEESTEGESVGAFFRGLFKRGK